MMRDEWLRRQKAYQADTYGVDWEDLHNDSEHLTTYVTTMMNAAFLELAEAQQETPWKPWATTNKRQAWIDNRDKFVGELVDVLFFVANSLVAVGCSDEELELRYLAKMKVNEKRQEDGYDGVSTKCSICKKALDEPGMTEADIIVNIKGQKFCSSSCELIDAGF